MEHTLNEEELYIALSDLFVNNQIDYNHMASVAKLFPISYVEYVLFNYVAPACYYNTITPVPSVCYFFDKDELINKINKINNIKKNKKSPINKIKMSLFAIYLKFKFIDEWKTLKNLL